MAVYFRKKSQLFWKGHFCAIVTLIRLHSKAVIQHSKTLEKHESKKLFELNGTLFVFS